VSGARRITPPRRAEDTLVTLSTPRPFWTNSVLIAPLAVFDCSAR
jgi:hypothetical protein